MDNTTNKIGPKDVFGQFLAIIGLYVCVIAFGTLIFGLIDIYFPDALRFGYFGNAGQILRWPLAILVVVFPLFLWWNNYLQKDLEKNPAKKELKTRKWLLHFTLFAAAIIIIGDLISVVFRFLSGDLTIQFILKVLTVFAIALVVFVYYLWNIRKDIPAMSDPGMRLFIRIVVMVGAFFIVFGFITAGSPFAERERRFDERRVQDLQTIQSEVINYWQAKDDLPQNIDQLRDNIRGFSPPQDPQTGEPYEYRVLGSLEFELCAVFNASNTKETGIGLLRPFDTNNNWLHDAGRACFDRTIDPVFYPKFQPKAQ